MSDPIAAPDVLALRPFVPAKDFAASLSFYVDLGFRATRLDKGLSAMELGRFGFLLQEYDVPGFAENFMMHLLVEDLDAWWQRIAALDLAARYRVRAPSAPAMQPWGLRVLYVYDPTGVLWHIAERPAARSTGVH